jgi:ABC-type dipeptide/oligopeptide/nickel transport system permease component
MNRPTFKECMAEALQPVVQKHRRRYERWARPAAECFGDENLKAKSVMPKVLARFVVSLPIAVVGMVLCATVIGLPLGIPVLLWVGGFISRPIRQLPAFNTDTSTADDD